MFVNKIWKINKNSKGGVEKNQTRQTTRRAITNNVNILSALVWKISSEYYCFFFREKLAYICIPFRFLQL